MSVTIALLWNEIMLRLFAGALFMQGIAYLFFFSLAFGCVTCAVAHLFSEKWNRGIHILVMLVLSLWFDIMSVVHDTFGVYMSVNALRTGAGGVAENYTDALSRAIAFGLLKYIVFCIPVLVFIVLDRKYHLMKQRSKWYAGCMLLIAVAAQVTGGSIAKNGLDAQKYVGQNAFDSSVSTFGLVTGTRLDSQNMLGGHTESSAFAVEQVEGYEEDLDETSVSSVVSVSTESVVGESEDVEEKPAFNVMDIDFDALGSDDEEILALNAYVKSQVPSRKNDYTGLFEGKNLIMICAEAFSDCVVSKELTPTLYRMIHNGFYFSEYYQPTWGGSTSTGEYSMVIGLAPLHGIDTMQEVKENNLYFTMGRQMQRLGYYSAAFHNGAHDFYKRNETHENLGYDSFTAMGNGLEDITGEWPEDDVFFKKTMNTYLEEEPFSIYYMSVSGHCIYEKGNPKVAKYYDKVKEFYGDKYKETTLYYICYQMAFENALKKMVKKLEEEGLADDTVICITSDHYPYGLEKSTIFKCAEDYVTDLYGYEYMNSWEKDHNTCIIWSGCLENEYKDMACEIEGPSYSLDILPTLSNLFGVTYDSRLLPGRDVLAEGTEPLVLWNNHSWATLQGKYDGNTNTFYPNKGYEEDAGYIEKMNTIVSNKLKYSGKVAEKDYWGYLFGKVDQVEMDQKETKPKEKAEKNKQSP